MLLSDDWSPALSVQSVCLSILSMLASAKEKSRPPDDMFYVKTCSKNPKKTRWWFHDDSVWYYAGQLLLPSAHPWKNKGLASSRDTLVTYYGDVPKSSFPLTWSRTDSPGTNAKNPVQCSVWKVTSVDILLLKTFAAIFIVLWRGFNKRRQEIGEMTRH